MEASILEEVGWCREASPKIVLLSRVFQVLVKCLAHSCDGMGVSVLDTCGRKLPHIALSQDACLK